MMPNWKSWLGGIALAGIAPIQAAQALSCARLSLQEQYDAADLIYVGYVRKIKHTVDSNPLNNFSSPSPETSNRQWQNAQLKATLVVEEVLKGSPPKSPTLHANSFFPIWGPWMTNNDAVEQSRPFSWFIADILPGRRYLVFETAGNPPMLGGCSPSRLLPERYDIQILKSFRRLRDRQNMGELKE